MVHTKWVVLSLVPFCSGRRSSQTFTSTAARFDVGGNLEGLRDGLSES